MIRLFKYASRLQVQAATLSLPIAALVVLSATSAASLDFNVPSGNYNVASNWVDSTTGAPATAAPTYYAADPNTTPPTPAGDDAFVRNGGTLTINTDVANHLLRLGAGKTITDPNDPNATIQVGGAGTLNWTAGKITAASGTADIGAAGFTPPPTDNTTYYGPDIRLGQHILANAAATPPTPDYDFAGIVNQNGATTEVDLLHTTSRINIGESGFSSTPTSTYNLLNGTIAVVNSYNVPFVGFTQGSNGNNGINVKSGTFNMSGGQIIDKTLAVAAANGQSNPTLDTQQRWLTIASTSGLDANNLNVSTATFTGGTVDVLGGLRVATGSNSRGFLNISGTASIHMGNEISVGYNVTNGVGVMNMSGGQFTADSNMQIGHRGNGTLNLSGGTVTVGADLRVGAQTTSPDSLVNMTGGTLTTKTIRMQIQPPGAGGTPTILIDGPNAVFVQGPNGGTDEARIGAQGPALFEVRQGQATLHQVQLGNVNTNGTTSNGTINVKGGRLKITGPVLKTDVNATSIVNLTGGILEITPKVAGAASWGLDFANMGSELVLNPSTIQQVTISNTSFNPNFSMSSGSWDIELGSNVTASGADRFIVSTGTASLTGGTLNISRINGYTPAINDTLTILQGASAALTAGTVSLAGDPGWSLISNPTQIQLKYVGPTGVSGDYNGNGVVDAADYVLWRKGGALQNDPTPGNQAADYTYWRSRFGATSGAGAGLGTSSAAVPEPSSIALVVFSLLGMFAAGRPRNRMSVEDLSAFVG